MIENDQVTSMIFWGPPGVGKTTLARIIAHQTESYFVDFSAVTSGIKEIKEVMKQADQRKVLGQKTILFVDEIHRFNKAQQDAFLPYVEKGSIILIGATTENPSFEINSALLSRCRVFVLNALEQKDLEDLIVRAISSSKGLGNLRIDISQEDIEAIAAFSGGDARFCLNTLEMVVYNSPSDVNGIHVSKEILKQCLQKRSLLYDKKGKSITILFRLFIRACAIRMCRLQFTGWQECWKLGKILYMLPEELCDLPVKTLAWLIQELLKYAWLLIKPVII